MAELKAEGEALKKLVLMGKKRTMNFAFNPGKKTDHTLIVDRRLKPEILRKAAKTEGEGAKVAFGTFVLSGKKLEMTCETTVPAMAKTLKKYLLTQKLSVNVVILDAQGQTVESDIEDLGNDASEDDDDQQAADAQQDADEKPAAADDQPDARQIAKALAERIKALQPTLAAAPDNFKKAFAAAVSQFKAANFEAATKTISVLEQAASKLGQSKQTEEAAKEDTQAADAKPQPDPRALVGRATGLRDAIASISGPAAEKLGAALAGAIKQIKAGNLAAADTLLGKIEVAANKTMAAVAKQSQEDTKEQPAAQADAPAQDGDSEAAEDAKQAEEDAKDQAAQQKWEAEQARLQPLVDQMIAEKRGDLAAINRFFNYAKDQAEAGDFAKALAAATRTETLLKDAAAATQTAAVEEAEAAIPDDVVPYVKSRLAWIKTRADLQKELTTLKTAIEKIAADVEGLEALPSKTQVLFEYLDDIDTDLENTLERLVETPEGTSRDNLKNAAMQIIGTYRDVLDTKFFKDVDNNGFVQTSIRASALSSLDDVSAALAL